MSTFHGLHPDKGDICTYIISIYTSHTCTSEFLFILERIYPVIGNILS